MIKLSLSFSCLISKSIAGMYLIFHTVVGDYNNIMKTTFNFHFYQSLKHHGYTKTWKQREAVNLKSFSEISCKFVIRKKLVNN